MDLIASLVVFRKSAQAELHDLLFKWECTCAMHMHLDLRVKANSITKWVKSYVPTATETILTVQRTKRRAHFLQRWSLPRLSVKIAWLSLSLCTYTRLELYVPVPKFKQTGKRLKYTCYLHLNSLSFFSKGTLSLNVFTDVKTRRQLKLELVMS